MPRPGHNLEEKIPGEILVRDERPGGNREGTLFVDRAALAKAQVEHDVLTANQVLMDAFL